MENNEEEKNINKEEIEALENMFMNDETEECKDQIYSNIQFYF